MRMKRAALVISTAAVVVAFGASTPAQAYTPVQGECFRAPCPVATSVRSLAPGHPHGHYGWRWGWTWGGGW